MGKLITKQQAADMLGVSPRTINDWIANGILRRHTIKRTENTARPFMYLDTDSLSAVQDTVNDTKRLQEALTKEHDALEKQLHELRNTAALDNYCVQLFLTHAVDAMYNTEFCPPRTVSIIRCLLLYGRTYKQVADDLGLSKQRVTQIFSQEMQRMKNRICRLHQALDRESVLSNENAALVAENRLLRQKLSEHETTAQESNLIEQLLVQPMEQYRSELSARALNGLKYADIQTIGDLVNYNRTKLLSMRNFGRKSITELDEFLERRGLTWKNV